MDDLILLISISIHALRVEGDGDNPIPTARRGGISIHALRVEGDQSVTRAEWADAGQFLSTPSGWRATPCRLWR